MRIVIDRVAIRAIAIGVILMSPCVARADVAGPEDEPCINLKEGEVCDDPLREQGGPGYRGVCVLVHFGEYRSRMRCQLPELTLSKEEAPCFRTRANDRCWRESGAEGRCVDSRQIKVPAFGGGTTVDLPIRKCARIDKDRSGDVDGWLLVGGVVGASALFAGGLMWRQRRARGKQRGAETGGDA